MYQESSSNIHSDNTGLHIMFKSINHTKSLIEVRHKRGISPNCQIMFFIETIIIEAIIHFSESKISETIHLIWHTLKYQLKCSSLKSQRILAFIKRILLELVQREEQ